MLLLKLLWNDRENRQKKRQELQIATFYTVLPEQVLEKVYKPGKFRIQGLVYLYILGIIWELNLIGKFKNYRSTK